MYPVSSRWQLFPVGEDKNRFEYKYSTECAICIEERVKGTAAAAAARGTEIEKRRMSDLLNENRHFVRLLLDSTRIQCEALLDTVSLSQTRSVSQLCRNLVEMPIKGEKAVESVRKNEKLLRKLGNRTLSAKAKGHLISKHRKRIIEVFRLCRDIVGEAVDVSVSGRTPSLAGRIDKKEEEVEEVVGE